MEDNQVGGREDNQVGRREDHQVLVAIETTLSSI